MARPMLTQIRDRHYGGAMSRRAIHRSVTVIRRHRLRKRVSLHLPRAPCVVPQQIHDPCEGALSFRIFFNIVVVIVYVTVNVTIGAVVSERPYVSAGDLWRCPEIDTMLTPRTSRLGSVATIIYFSTRALVAATWMDLSRLGGGIAEMFIPAEIPAETESSFVDYSHNEETKPPPRKLHAFNGRCKIQSRMTKSAALPAHKVKAGRSLLGKP